MGGNRHAGAAEWRWHAYAEPLVPVFLAGHGAALLSTGTQAPPLEWTLIGVTFLLGAAGLAGWRTPTSVSLRAWFLVALTWQLLALTGGVTGFFTLWYFLLAPIYSLALGGFASFSYPIVIGLGYLALAPLTVDGLPGPVLWGRATVITATGLLVAGISAAQRRAFEEAAASKDEFITSVSHELRTPLTVVVGLTAELRERVSDLTDSDAQEFASVAHGQATEVAHIIDNLLVAARADIHQLTVITDAVDLRAEVEAVVAEVAQLHDLPRSRVIVSGEVAVAADPTRVRQILRNLVANAFWYGGAHIEMRIGAHAGRGVVEAVDDGPGIPEGEVSHLFEHYRRFREHQGRPASIGLGLFVSRTLADLMGGTLSYQRGAGWTVFRLELPLSHALGTASAEPRLPAVESRRPSRRERSHWFRSAEHRSPADGDASGGSV
ncbi:MAG: HAMP domain-containing sensor histidine kinase [Acidimicrobiia bacterium]|nr:HAMP domain-containing sensor histidine kinase [Acidimicrobiia bacterium]